MHPTTSPLSTIDRNRPVLVTGASGYVASWIIKLLLDAGYKVRGTVRSLAQIERYQHLLDIAAAGPGSFEPYEADLLQEGTFDEAVQGCSVVFHTASPFLSVGVKDPERQLIAPALQGTHNVLAAVEKAASVETVVLTSSVAALYGDNADISTTQHGVFSEFDWNRTSNIRHQPYPYSKTLAEQEAWKIARSQNRWKLVVVNPGFVLGPSLTTRVDSTSIALLRDYLRGKLAFGVPALSFGIVDVRDVAAAHLAAAFTADAEGRHLLVAENASLLAIAEAIEHSFPGRYKLPRWVLPKSLTYFVGPFFGLSWPYIAKNIGIPIAFDNTRSKRLLGIEYRPLSDTVHDHVQQLIRDELI